MSIYQPTSAEIDHIIESGAAKHPTLASRYQRADHLLRSRALHYRNGWQCDSQNRADQTYDLSARGCTCYDYLNSQCRIAGRVFCKHLVAFYVYREILILHLNQRLTGNLRFSNERRRAAQWPDALLILDTNSRPRLLSYIDGHKFPRAICHVRLDKRGRQVPTTDSDLANFALWLADARPAPQADLIALLDDEALASARAQVIAQANSIERLEVLDAQVW